MRTSPSTGSGCVTVMVKGEFPTERDMYEAELAEVKRIFDGAEPEVSPETHRMTHEEAFYAGIWW